MNNSLADFFKSWLDRRDRLKSLDEASTKQGLVLPILQMLGWQLWNIDEVTPEFIAGTRHIAYALRPSGIVKVFLDVKRPSENLGMYQEQLLALAVQQGVKMAVLTNGLLWWFYVPLNEGSGEQRRFLNVDIWKQNPFETAQHFTAFLSRTMIDNGQAFLNADEAYQGNRKNQVIAQTIPRVWKKLIEEPDELLIILMTNAVEQSCGFRPDFEVVARFLRTQLPSAVNRAKTQLPSHNPVSTARLPAATGTSLRAITFHGHVIPVNSWIESLRVILQRLQTECPEAMEKCLTVGGRKRPYFSLNERQLRKAERLRGTEIFFETNLSARQITDIVGRLLSVLGYPQDTVSYDILR